MSRTLRILLAGMVAVVFASVTLAAPASAESLESSSHAQSAQSAQGTHENRQLDPEDARPGGGAAPFETGVVVVLNALLLGGLVGGVVWGRRRLGCADAHFPRMSF